MGYVRLATAGDVKGPGDPASGHADAALVLGAKVGDDGEPSPFLRERVELGAQPLPLRRGRPIVMTGGASHERGYDEPATMRDLAVSLGVQSDAIILDREGVDTFASCANTAALELGDVIVVTQEFHVARAVWLCQRADAPPRVSIPQSRAEPGPSRATSANSARTGRLSSTCGAGAQAPESDQPGPRPLISSVRCQSSTTTASNPRR